MNLVKGYLKKLGGIFELHPELMNREVNHDEIYENNFLELQYLREPYVRKIVLSLVFVYAKFT